MKTKTAPISSHPRPVHKRRPRQVRRQPRFKLSDQAPLHRLKNILVPIDFSKESRKALEYAIPFAAQFGATLSLVHVIEPAPGLSGMENVPLLLPNADILEG